MTDFTAGGPPASPPEGQASLRILAQFIRDLSFENPHAPDSLRGGVQPQIELGVELNARGRPDGLFEVDMKLAATAKRETETAFHVELVYAGLFEITGVPEEALEAVLMVECPRFLFPFARRLISDLTAEGGFPPFLLEVLDFAAIYEQRRQNGGGMIGNA